MRLVGILVAALLVALALGAQSRLTGHWPWMPKSPAPRQHHRQPGSVPGRMRIDGKELVSPVSPQFLGGPRLDAPKSQRSGFHRAIDTVFGPANAWRKKLLRADRTNTVSRKDETE